MPRRPPGSCSTSCAVPRHPGGSRRLRRPDAHPGPSGHRRTAARRRPRDPRSRLSRVRHAAGGPGPCDGHRRPSRRDPHRLRRHAAGARTEPVCCPCGRAARTYGSCTPLDAVRIARDLPDRQVVLLAVGFWLSGPGRAPRHHGCRRRAKVSVSWPSPRRRLLTRRSPPAVAARGPAGGVHRRGGPVGLGGPGHHPLHPCRCPACGGDATGRATAAQLLRTGRPVRGGDVCAAGVHRPRTRCGADVCRSQTCCTGMALVPVFASGTGTLMVSTPSLYSAVASSPFAPAGSRRTRAKVP